MGRARRHLGTWFERQRITSLVGGISPVIRAEALALATVREARDLPVTTPRTLVRTAFAGGPVPWDILSRAVRRNRAEQGVSRPRAALIKLALLSQSNDHQEITWCNWTPATPTRPTSADVSWPSWSGAQRAAIRPQHHHRGRFYGTASTAPQSVFSRLIRGSRAHLSTLERDNRGALTPFKPSWRR